MKRCIAVLTFIILATSLATAESGYHVEQMELHQAWEITEGTSDVTVAVLSTGVNYRLNEISGKIERDPLTAAYGYDATSNTMDPFDGYGLGTMEASLIAGESLGVAPGARIVPIRIFDDSAMGYDGAIERGLAYAVHREVDIIALAVGIGKPGDSICKALRHASDAGILIVAAAGNYGREVKLTDYPVICGAENIIVVAASNANGDLAHYSSYDFRYVQTATPGDVIQSMDHTGLVTTGSGTSFSTALTAGVAALVKSAHPNYSPLQIKEALIRGTIPTAGLRGKVSSNGFLSAYKALTVELGK